MDATLSQNVKRLMAAVVRVSLPANGANGANGHRQQLRLFTVQDASEILDMPPEFFVGRVERGKMQGLWLNGVCHVSVHDVAEESKRRALMRQGILEIIRISEEAGLYELNDFPDAD